MLKNMLVDMFFKLIKRNKIVGWEEWNWTTKEEKERKEYIWA